MIPLKEQEGLRQRFKFDLPNRLRLDMFSQRPSSIFIAGREECVYCSEIQTLLEELASLCDRISLSVHEYADSLETARALGVDRVPAFVIRGLRDRAVRYFGLPTGLLFPGLIETLVDASRGEVDLLPDSVRLLKRLKSEVKLQVLVTTPDPFSFTPARTALKLGLHNANIKVDVIEVVEFPALVQKYRVRSVPTTVVNERYALAGAMDEATLVGLVMQTATGKPFSGQTFTGPSVPYAPPEAQRAPEQPRVASSGLILPH